MVYLRQQWLNGSLTAPDGPINGTRLNHMEDGIANTTGVFYNVKADAYGAVGDGVTQDASAIQAAINACSANGGGIVWLPQGTYLIDTTIQLPSDVMLCGVGKNISTLQASGSVAAVLSNKTTGGMVQRIACRDLAVVGNSATASARGIQFLGVELSYFENLRISGYTGTSQVPVELTSWSDGGTYRPTRENTWVNIETVGTNGIKLTKNGSDPSTSGANNNSFLKPRCSSYTNIGINIDAGEGNTIYGAVCSTPTDATTGIRVNDDVNGLYGCNTDCSAGGGNTAIGVKVESGANDTFIISRTGNGPTTPISDSGTNTVIFRHPLTHLGGTVLLGSATTGLGFYGATTIGKQTISGSKAGNVALSNLISLLETMGLLNDSTT